MLEAHAHNFLLTGISPEKLGDPGLGNCLYEYNCRRSPGCTKQVLQVCAGVSRALSGPLETTNTQAVGQNPCWQMLRTTLWSAARSGAQEGRATHRQTYQH